MRREFELSEKQLSILLEASKPVTYMVFAGIPPASQQARSNAAWKALGAEMGFDDMTIRPVEGKGIRYFTAEAMEI